MRAETLAEQLFFSTVYLRGDDGAGTVWTGTGFIINYEVEHGGYVPILVTNKHVLENATTLTIRMVRGVEGQPTPSATETSVLGFNHATWLGHPRPEVDVAVIGVNAILEQMAQDGAEPFYRGFTADLLLTAEQAQDLDALESVTFVGYPNGLYDTANFLPIARRGQTATPLQNNYKDLPAFLIDASVFGGSSGSPVVIFDRGTYTNRAGQAHVGTRFHLLGVVASVHVRQVLGDVLDLPTTTVARIEDPIDLGIVFKASAIQDCVNLLFKQVGLTPKASAAPAEPLEGRN